MILRQRMTTRKLLVILRLLRIKDASIYPEEDTEQDSLFPKTSFTLKNIFSEQEAGMQDLHQLPLAEDPKNHRCTDDCHDIFYRIIGRHFSRAT